ncbi:MAG: diguanylate cyclase [Thermodesulfobacteriota bacterium]
MKTILVVDNHPVVLKLMVEFLRRLGHHVLSAEDGLGALELLRHTRPDIVFTDLIMPNIDGEKLCQVIRGREELKEIPIVIYSATVLEDEANIHKMGANVCIAKGPFKNTEDHIAKVIKHIDNGTLSELAGKILGGEDLYKRHITTELLFSKRHYEVLFDSMPEGVVEFTFDGRIFHTNAAAVALCQLREENLLGTQFLDLFTAQHRDRVRRLLMTIEESPAVIDEAHPVQLNGREVAINFLPIKDEEHEFIVAIMRDLTEKLRTSRELERLRQQQARILNAVGEGIFGVDQEQRITFVNPAALAMLGYEQSELVGQQLHEVVHSCETPESENREPGELCPIWAAGLDGLVRKGTETFWCKDGTSFPVRYTSTPIVENYETRGAVVTFADITERKKWEEKLRESVVTDELTGLYNRRGFMTLAEKLVKISGRERTDLVLIYIDFDNMKWINDTLGHAIGDEAIIETAGLLRDTFRVADVIARIGGDEFVVLCTDNTTLGNQEAILARLKERIDNVNALPSRQYPLSMSFGLARLCHDAPCSISELLSQADQAMYRDKEEKKQRHREGYRH